MPQLIYFVTENYLKVNTTITANVNITEILPLVKGAADMWTQYTLGTYFYDYLLTKYNAQTLTPDEEILVGYMQPSIAWRACADAVLELSYQLKNKGIQSQSGDFSTNSESKMIQMMNRHYVQKAEFYENALWKYLKKNKDLYPQFTSPLNHNSNCLAACTDCLNGCNTPCNCDGHSGKFDSPIILI